MPAPSILFNEPACFDALKAFLVRCCAPDVDAVNIYRSHAPATPSAVPGPSITLIPLQGGLPINSSTMGERSIAKQVQKVHVKIKTAATGSWTLSILGTEAVFVAGAEDTPTTIRNGLKTAVDLLGLPITTQALVITSQPTLVITANVAGVSMLVRFLAGDIPAGGVGTVDMVDDCLRACSYNFGIWTVRIVVRDMPPLGGGVQNRVQASQLAERIRCWFQANATKPITAGLAYPTEGDQMILAPARLMWRNTEAPISLPELEGGVWTRAVGLDVSFDVPTGMAYDVPSLDSTGPGTFAANDP